MPTIAQPVDTQEMIIVHRVFRREFRQLPALIRAVSDGDRHRQAIVGEHLHDLTHGLHHHHAAEDDLLWPPLLQRVQLHADLVHRMQAQHHHLSGLLDQVDDLAAAWSTAADQATAERLAAVVAQTSAALDEHLADEENEILPLVAQHLTQAEWTALNDQGKKAFPKNAKVFVFIGLILHEATPSEQKAFLRLLLVPVRWAWHTVGQSIYRRAHARINAA